MGNTIEDLRKYCTQPDWDEYGADPLSEKTIDRLATIRAMLNEGYELFAMPSGGGQFEVENNAGVHIEVQYKLFDKVLVFICDSSNVVLSKCYNFDDIKAKSYTYDIEDYKDVCAKVERIYFENLNFEEAKNAMEERET